MRAMDPLQVAMTGVRMGERYLQLFCSDVILTGGLAAKTGLSGVASLAAPDEKQAARAKSAADKAGVLIDIKLTRPFELPWPASSFDMIVIDNTAGAYAALSSSQRQATLDAMLRLLRPGGRAEIIERQGDHVLRGGSSARTEYAHAGGAEGTLRAAGFKPVRTLAEKDGFRFVEGLKG